MHYSLMIICYGLQELVQKRKPILSKDKAMNTMFDSLRGKKKKVKSKSASFTEEESQYHACH